MCVSVCVHVLMLVLTLCAWVSIGGEFHVVARKQTLPPIELSFPPVTVIVVEHCDYLTLLEGQLIIVLGHIVVHADNLTYSFKTRNRKNGNTLSFMVLFENYMVKLSHYIPVVEILTPTVVINLKCFKERSILSLYFYSRVKAVEDSTSQHFQES